MSGARILRVANLGQPVLRQVAEAVPESEITGDLFQAFCEDLLATMRYHRGAGLAAPQVHVSQRVVVYEVAGNPRYPDAEDVALTWLVNPVITPLTDEMDEAWEGCLSLKELRGLVPRYTRVHVEALGRDGLPLSFDAEGFHARVIQHECDHLDGVVFIDRMRDLSQLGFLPDVGQLMMAGR